MKPAGFCLADPAAVRRSPQSKPETKARARAVIVGYFEDGPNLVTMAMNDWADAEPAWWHNLQAHPDVTVDLVGGPRQVSGRAAQGDERERLWARWRQIDENLDAYTARRSRQTAVVVLEPYCQSHDMCHAR